MNQQSDVQLNEFLNTINSISANPCLLETYVKNNIQQMEMAAARVAASPNLSNLYGDRINQIRAANPSSGGPKELSFLMEQIQSIALWLLDNGFEMGANLLMSVFGC